MRVEILPHAEADLEQAVHFYNTQRSELGFEFLDEFRRGIDRIIEQPQGWQALGKPFRRYRLRRFPYSIIYKAAENDDLILIEAVRHLSRKPK